MKKPLVSIRIFFQDSKSNGLINVTLDYNNNSKVYKTKLIMVLDGK
jgi:hypothetical protein